MSKRTGQYDHRIATVNPATKKTVRSVGPCDVVVVGSGSFSEGPVDAIGGRSPDRPALAFIRLFILNEDGFTGNVASKSNLGTPSAGVICPGGYNQHRAKLRARPSAMPRLGQEFPACRWRRHRCPGPTRLLVHDLWPAPVRFSAKSIGWIRPTQKANAIPRPFQRWIGSNSKYDNRPKN